MSPMLIQQPALELVPSYAWNHFVQHSEENDVFALSPGNTDIRPLGDFMTGVFELEDDSFVDEDTLSLGVLPQAPNRVQR